MIFHVLSLPYAPTHKNVSLCTFVQKVYNFCEEMTRKGHTVIHYGMENSHVHCSEHVNVLPYSFFKNDWQEKGFNQNIDSPAFIEFNKNANRELKSRIKSKKEFVLCWFGFGHYEAVKDLDCIIVEPSIGYDSMFAEIKIFETYAQMHKMHGVSQTWANIGKEFVVYPGFRQSDFEFNTGKNDRGLFLGRITKDKGAEILYEICNDMRQYIDFAGPNLLGLKETKYCTFHGCCGPTERKWLLSNAKFLAAPSLFFEPCNWSVIEAHFSGTPTITTDFGGFTETNIDGVTGRRITSLYDLPEAIERIEEISSFACLENANSKFTLDQQMNNYLKIFNQLQ